jgi:hypothetical protein
MDSQDARRLRNHVCIGTSPDAAHEWPFGGARFTSRAINSVDTSNDIDSAVNACVDGLGLGMFLSYMVALKPKQGASSSTCWRNSKASRRGAGDLSAIEAPLDHRTMRSSTNAWQAARRSLR